MRVGWRVIPTLVAVAGMSGGASDGSCPKPSATAPYVEITRAAGAAPLRKLRHLRTGRVRFTPESAG